MKLHKDGWWFVFKNRRVGPFEFLTEAVLTQLTLENLIKFKQAAPERKKYGTDKG